MAPPGLTFLFHLVVPQILSVLTVYGALKFLIGPLLTSSTSLYLLGAFLIRPIYFLVRLWYVKVQNVRRAVQMGAVQLPVVNENSYKALLAVLSSFDGGYIGECFVEWGKQYGNTYRVEIFGQERIMTTEPAHIKAILATQFNDFEKGPLFFEQAQSLLGLGVFNSDGERWKFHRNMTRPFFTKTRVSDFENFERHAESTISVIKARLAQGYPIEFQDVVARFTLDSATEFLFGKDVESLGAPLPYPDGSPLARDSAILNHPSNIFVRAFRQGQTETALRVRTGSMWALREFWSDKVLPHRKKVDEYVNPILEERKTQLQEMTTEKADDDGEGETFLDHLIRSTEDKQLIKDELLNILVAGRDSTASLITFCIYVLTQRPDITKKLRNEILEKVGVNTCPTYKTISDMKYLRAVINETLRLYPPVPFDGRTTNAPTVLPSVDGQPAYYIPAGVECVYSVFLMHRREDLWGPDALDFDPNRFLDERLHKYLTPNPFIFLPFNAGPRICLGQQFAYNETSYFLIKFLQTFTDFQMAWDVQPESSKTPVEWKPMPGTTKGREKVLLSTSLTMGVKDALWVRMKVECLGEAD